MRFTQLLLSPYGLVQPKGLGHPPLTKKNIKNYARKFTYWVGSQQVWSRFIVLLVSGVVNSQTIQVELGFSGSEVGPTQPYPQTKEQTRTSEMKEEETVSFLMALLQRCCGSCVRTTLLFGDRREGPPTGLLPVFRRRLITGVGSASLVAFGANFAGITSFLLGLSPDIGRRLKLDVLYPVDGYSRCLDANQGFGEIDYF